MKITRKEFLSFSGKIILGAPILNSLFLKPSSALPLSETLNSGDVMIEVKIKRLNLVHTWTISRNSSDFKENVFVKLEKDGIVGYGEAAPNVRYGENAQLTVQRIHEAESIYHSTDFFHYMDIKEKLDNTILDQSCAKAALDIALMDWIGKAFGVPLYKLWGLNTSHAPVTSFSIGIDTPEVIKQKVKEAEPYPILKVKVGTKRDEEIIGAVRSVTDKPIRVDANEGWKSKEEALEKIQWLKTQGVEFIEQPLPSDMIEETAWLRERVDMPIIADEAVKTAADIPKLAGAYDGINIKLMKSGGLLEAWRMIQIAKALNLKIMLGCMIESSIAISAAAHLAPYVDWADLDGNLLISNDPFSGVKVNKGKFIYNDKPGLGVEGEF
ncbi:MAG: dipeptide epimerase [Calditrichaeota bacterium]|nr:MAG: dipeptide epimerase [Calditrichota bacterium]